MWLVAGLGNPGPEYAATRHNIGFLALDRISGSAKFSKKFSGEAASIALGRQKLILLKPLTYMNDSGRSVLAAMGFHKIPPEHVIIIHDELALPLGKLRIKMGGGANGHNGIRSIDAAVGPDFWRIRLGIGHPGDKREVHDHVLSRFSKDEMKDVEKITEALARHFELFFSHSPEALGSKVAAEITPPREKNETKPKRDDKAAAGE